MLRFSPVTNKDEESRDSLAFSCLPNVAIRIKETLLQSYSREVRINFSNLDITSIHITKCTMNPNMLDASLYDLSVDIARVNTAGERVYNCILLYSSPCPSEPTGSISNASTTEFKESDVKGAMRNIEENCAEIFKLPSDQIGIKQVAIKILNNVDLKIESKLMKIRDKESVDETEHNAFIRKKLLNMITGLDNAVSLALKTSTTEHAKPTMF